MRSNQSSPPRSFRAGKISIWPAALSLDGLLVAWPRGFANSSACQQVLSIRWLHGSRQFNTTNQPGQQRWSDRRAGGAQNPKTCITYARLARNFPLSPTQSADSSPVINRSARILPFCSPLLAALQPAGRPARRLASRGQQGS